MQGARGVLINITGGQDMTLLEVDAAANRIRSEVDDEANIIFGDFGAASMYHMLSDDIQLSIKTIEQRALKHFIDDLLSICVEEDKNTTLYQNLILQVK